nr:AmpH [Beauveria felina]
MTARIVSTNCWDIGSDIDGPERLNGDVPLNYRVSRDPIAHNTPSNWANAIFDEVLHQLPGSEGPWGPLTYPRFQPLDGGDLLLEFRIGRYGLIARRSGSGDSYIHRYSARSGLWQPYGMYVQGNDNNAYINGLDTHDGKLYTSWTVRETPDANTNHDLFFAYSEDDGQTWFNTNGMPLPKPLLADAEEAMIWRISQNSGMVNQEAQLVDSEGRFHMLMRSNISGSQAYEHYVRSVDGTYPLNSLLFQPYAHIDAGVWSINRIAPGSISPPDLYAPRGKLAADASGQHLIALLPDEPARETRIYTSTSSAVVTTRGNSQYIYGASVRPGEA